MFLQSLGKLNNSISVRNFAPKIQVKNKKRVFTIFWFYLNPEFRISCSQLGITRQKNEGSRHILPPSLRLPPPLSGSPPLRINAYAISNGLR